jgi:AbrB family looped-hinge helix DNA binding protein
MKSVVTTEGQITIPKALREQFSMRPGAVIDFLPGEDGIRLLKVMDDEKSKSVLGMLRAELAGRTVAEWINELRGPVELGREPRTLW